MIFPFRRIAPGLCLGVFFCLTLSPAVFASQDLAQWAKSAQWRNLVHYKKGWLGIEGQADSSNFYLAKNGKDDPVAELKATLDEFQKPDNLAVVCRFPARYEWLKSKVPGLDIKPLEKCGTYKEFFDKLQAHSVSLIFSSYFINTPASAFGHTLLRMNSAQHREDNQDQAELLDYGINYAALMDTPNVLAYAFKGILGLFDGTFTAVPYYYKVREYNDFESRDLWEYKLNFTQAQIDLMVAHIWELGPIRFDYKFFTENCSYFILAILEVGNPSLKLTDRLPSLYVIPIDTVRVLFEEPGLVKSGRYRPSVLSRLEKRSEGMSDKDIQLVRQMVEEPEKSQELIQPLPSEKMKAHFLDTSVEAFDFLNAENLVYKPKEAAQRRHELLLTRSGVDHISNEPLPEPSPENWPDQGHLSQRFGFGAGYRDLDGKFGTASMRFALHDLLDPLPGQPTFSEIHFFGVTGRLQQKEYGDSQKLYLENFDLFRVSSFQPVTSWQNPMSWTAKFGMRTVQDGACDQCQAANMDVGAGATIGPHLSESFLALLTKFELDYSHHFSTNFRAAIGPEVWGRWVPNRHFSFLAKLGYKWSNYFESPLFSDQIFTRSLEARYHIGKTWSIWAKGEGYEKDGHTAQLGFYRFF